MLSIHDLSFSFSQKRIFHNLCFHLKKGSSAAILGASGSGKTTLFQMITGLLTGYTGSILIDGMTPTKRTQQITYMMQKDLLLPWKTVLDNITLVGKLGKGTFSKDLVRSAWEWLDRFCLKEYAHCYPSQLSGGMRQKVALIRALLLNKPFLLLDEPFCSIDAIQRKDLQKLLVDLQKEKGITLLLITHDIFEAYTTCDQVFFLADGFLAQGMSHEEFQQIFPQGTNQSPFFAKAQRSTL